MMKILFLIFVGNNAHNLIVGGVPFLGRIPQSVIAQQRRTSLLPNITQLTMIRGGHDILEQDENATDGNDIYKRHGTGERGDDDEEMPSHSKSNESRNKSMTSKSCKSLNSLRAATSLYKHTQQFVEQHRNILPFFLMVIFVLGNILGCPFFH